MSNEYKLSYTAAQINSKLGEIDYLVKDAELGSLAKKDIVSKTDVSSDIQTSLNKADTALQSFTETDPTVPSWAKEPTKPAYTADEVGARPNTWMPTVADIGAYTKEQIMTAATVAKYGLPENSVPDDAFAFLGKYNQHWWERRINKAVIQLGEVENATLSAATSTSATDKVIYSDGITIDAATGGVSLSEPTTTITCSYSKYTNANVLAGKYFINYQDELYYAKPTAKAVQSSESSYYYSEIPASVVTATQKLGEWENLISSDRNAYPDSGISDGFEWQYLGIPFDNAVTAPKIVTGGYIGTGKYGTSNKNTLTFDSEPKMVFVTEEFREDDGSAYTSTGWVIFTQTDVMGYAYSNHSFGNESAFSMTPNWGKVLKWWSTDSADVQGNTAGTKYRYVAIC